MHRIARILHFLVCIASVNILSTPVAYSQSPQQIAQRAFRSTVLLVMLDSRGQPLTLGSGFLIGDGLIASNLHVIEGASSGYARVVGEAPQYQISGMVAVDHVRDLVVLKISNNRSTSLKIGDSDKVQIGDMVFAIGNPQGLEGTFSQGIVSGIRQVKNSHLLQITAPISPGSSGGPVLDKRGNVIGVSVATFKGGQNLNFAIPSNYLQHLTAQRGAIVPINKVVPSSKNKSIMHDLTGDDSDGVQGENFSWNNRYYSEGSYSFSFRNSLNQGVRNIYCLVIFYDEKHRPIDTDFVTLREAVPPRLAKRVTGWVHGSVQDIAETVEFRVLNFDLER